MPIDNKPEDDSNVNVAAITKEENKAYYLTVGVLALIILTSISSPFLYSYRSDTIIVL